MVRHILFETGIRRLGSKEHGFFYRYPDTGATVREERVLSRIEDLKVPPAWKETRIARSPSAKVQAVGYDSAGRVQYLYNSSYRECKEKEKFERLLRFAEALPEMRRATSTHLRHRRLDREKVLATMVRLMNTAYFRVGDERYARQNKTYGIATLRRKHLSIEGDTMTFEYAGKWGQAQRKAVTDKKLRRIVEECVGLPGYEIFKYYDEDGGLRDVKSRDLNFYIKEVMGGEFTAKDFRTWAGTLFAAFKLAESGAVDEKKRAEKNVLSAIDAVAERLGNTRDIARASYVSPKIIDHYLEGSVVAYHGEQMEEVIPPSKAAWPRKSGRYWTCLTRNSAASYREPHKTGLGSQEVGHEQEDDRFEDTQKPDGAPGNKPGTEGPAGEKRRPQTTLAPAAFQVGIQLPPNPSPYPAT